MPRPGRKVAVDLVSHFLMALNSAWNIGMSYGCFGWIYKLGTANEGTVEERGLRIVLKM